LFSFLKYVWCFIVFSCFLKLILHEDLTELTHKTSSLRSFWGVIFYITQFLLCFLLSRFPLPQLFSVIHAFFPQFFFINFPNRGLSGYVFSSPKLLYNTSILKA
jgi:hypothetical protein